MMVQIQVRVSGFDKMKLITMSGVEIEVYQDALIALGNAHNVFVWEMWNTHVQILGDWQRALEKPCYVHITLKMAEALYKCRIQPKLNIRPAKEVI